MTTVTKFRFETSFDAPAPLDESELEDSVPPPPVFSEAEMAQARADGAAEGFADGFAKASTGIEAQCGVAMEKISSLFEALAPDHRDALERSRVEVLTIARAVIAKTLPDMASENALALVETAIASVLPKLMDEPRAVIRTSDILLDRLQEIVDGLKRKSGYSGDIILLAEDGLGPADCTVEWADGGAEYHQDRIWQEINEAMDRFISGSRQAAALHHDVQNDTSQPEEKPHG